LHCEVLRYNFYNLLVGWLESQCLISPLVSFGFDLDHHHHVVILELHWLGHLIHCFNSVSHVILVFMDRQCDLLDLRNSDLSFAVVHLTLDDVHLVRFESELLYNTHQVGLDYEYC